MAELASFKTGVGCGLYRNTATYGSPTWTIQPEVQSVSVSAPWDWVEASSRASGAKLYGKSLMDLSFSVTMRADDLASDWEAFMAAALSRTTVMDLLILNGLISVEGVRGWRGEMLASMDGEPQEISGSIMTSFTLRPTMTTNGYPKSVIMGASSTPSFSAISV